MNKQFAKSSVIPAHAGIQAFSLVSWTPACAGVTDQR